MNRYIIPMAGKKVMGAFKTGKNLAVDKDGTLHVTGIEQIEEKIAHTVEDIAKSKAILAGAITERGVDTAADDSFAVMAENVRKIPTGLSAAVCDYCFQAIGGYGEAGIIVEV